MHANAPITTAAVPAHFSPDLEQAFQARYYATVRLTLRIVATLLAVLFLVYAGRDYYDTRSLALAGRQDGAPALFFLLLTALSFWPGFGRVWQPFLMVGAWIVAALALSGPAALFSGALLGPLPGPAGQAAPPPPPSSGVGPFSGQMLFLSLQTCILLVAFAVFRLPFRWAAGMQAGVLLAGVWAFTFYHLPGDIWRFLQPTVFVLVAVLLAAYVQEKLARGAFWANHLLGQERNAERRKREQTEATLGVLNQAIGGIVHDLGNPLTSVQTGAQTLRQFARDGIADPPLVDEFAGIIEDGAQMLDYLRLSLIEQSRVLEGKPTPLDLQATTVRPLVEAGARYQKPRLAAGREIRIGGDEALQIHADAMKMVTVLMNLIGNAFKYSDGLVQVVWRPAGQMLLIGVCDQGMGGRGITRAQAEKLFTAFGRLDTHAEIEGTGLGLLSVRKIVEAHGGEAFITGYEDGTPASAPFSTAAHGPYPSLLGGEWRTAFVVTCPLAQADVKEPTQPREMVAARDMEPALR